MLRASYGRFNQGVLTGELSPIHPGVTPTTTMAFDAATGGYTSLVSVVDPKINLALDPDTRTPRTDEYSIGLDREITAAAGSGGGVHPEERQRLHRVDGHRRASIAKRRGRWPTARTSAGVRAHERRGRPALPADEP